MGVKTALESAMCKTWPIITALESNERSKHIRPVMSYLEDELVTGKVRKWRLRKQSSLPISQ